MIRSFALNSTWPGYRAPMDPGVFVALILITLAVELGAFYGWYRSEKKDLLIGFLIIICGNLASAIIGLLVVAVWSL